MMQGNPVLACPIDTPLRPTVRPLLKGWQCFDHWCEQNGFPDVAANPRNRDDLRQQAVVDAFCAEYDGERQTLVLDLMEA